LHAPASYGTGQMLRPLYMRPGHRDVPRALLPHLGLPVSGPAPPGYSLARPMCPAT